MEIQGGGQLSITRTQVNTPSLKRDLSWQLGKGITTVLCGQKGLEDGFPLRVTLKSGSAAEKDKVLGELLFFPIPSGHAQLLSSTLPRVFRAAQSWT